MCSCQSNFFKALQFGVLGSDHGIMSCVQNSLDFALLHDSSVVLSDF